MVNPICRCGHYRSIHHFFDYGGSYCTDIKKQICPCMEYKLDNLKYLEQKANETKV